MMRDPILRCIPSWLRERTWLVFLLASAFYTSTMLFFSWAVSSFYTQRGWQFCSIYEWRELVSEIVVFGIVVPTLWSTFVWQPHAIQDLFLYFQEEGLIHAKREEVDSFLDQELFSPANRTRNLFIVIGGILLSLLLFGASIPQDDPFLWGYPTIWWRLNHFIFGLWLINIALFMYPIIWVIVRDFYFLRALYLFYHRFELHPKILHPDGCNGICEVGHYAMKVTIIIIILGGWVAYLIIFPTLFGKPGWNTNNFDVDTAAMMLVYLLAAPLSFWLPVWITHKAMASAKEKKLKRVSERIRRIVSDTNITLQNQEELRLLYERYSFLEENCKTWPFKLSAIGKIGFPMLLPLLSTLLSTWAEWHRP